ncbi:MAG: hypothetical protein K6E76_04620 [Patescibacteria group bacterium]|nr:hypothetical protein [Patescibacteria group bacterium]
MNNILGFSTDRTTLNAIDAILTEMNESKKQAHKRSLDLWNNGTPSGSTKRLISPDNAFVK